jgi:hypothetical protein
MVRVLLTEAGMLHNKARNSQPQQWGPQEWGGDDMGNQSTTNNRDLLIQARDLRPKIRVDIKDQVMVLLNGAYHDLTNEKCPSRELHGIKVDGTEWETGVSGWGATSKQLDVNLYFRGHLVGGSSRGDFSYLEPPQVMLFEMWNSLPQLIDHLAAQCPSISRLLKSAQYLISQQ